MTVLKTRAIYHDGVLKPNVKLDLPDGATVELEISTLPLTAPGDPKDALMDDEAALTVLYAEFSHEDRHLVREGLEHYADLLQHEEDQA